MEGTVRRYSDQEQWGSEVVAHHCNHGGKLEGGRQACLLHQTVQSRVAYTVHASHLSVTRTIVRMRE